MFLSFVFAQKRLNTTTTKHLRTKLINKKQKRSSKKPTFAQSDSNQLPLTRSMHVQHQPIELTKYSKLPMEEIANKLQVDKPLQAGNVRRDNKLPGDTGSVSVTAMAEVLVAKFKCNEEQPAPPPIRRMVRRPVGLFK